MVINSPGTSNRRSSGGRTVQKVAQLCSSADDLNPDHESGCRRGTGPGRGGLGRSPGAELQSEGRPSVVGVEGSGRSRRDAERRGRLLEDEEGGESGAECGEGR